MHNSNGDLHELRFVGRSTVATMSPMKLIYRRVAAVPCSGGALNVDIFLFGGCRCLNRDDTGKSYTGVWAGVPEMLSRIQIFNCRGLGE
jgi:hypothetical protein